MSNFLANAGVQPDGDLVRNKADGEFFSTTTNLGSDQLNGAITNSATTITVDSTSNFASSGTIVIDREFITYTGKTATTFTGCTRGQLGSTAVAHSDNDGVGEVYVSPWFDTDGWSTIESFFTSDVPSKNKGIVFQYSDDVNIATPTIRSEEFFEFNEANVRTGFLDVYTRPRLDGLRVIYANGSEAQSNVYISTTGRIASDTSLKNSGNASVVANFERQVALGNISNYSQNTKFGRNPEVDTGQAADIWDGGRAALGSYDYTGFSATANENLATVSSSTSDVGSLVSSGTVTTTGEKVIIDSTATFVTDGVAVGDIVLNDSRGTYGYVTSIDSETQLSVFKMQDGVIGAFDNISGNAYRVATTGSTGAAVVVWRRILNADLEKQVNKFVILNGTTTVTTTVDAYRCSRGKVLLAGSTGHNVGEITLNQATTSANVFCVMPATSNQTLIAADTVPKDELYLIETVQTAMSVSGGSAASAVTSLRVRPRYGVFNTERVYELSSQGGANTDEEIGGIVLAGGTDFKLRVDSVSSNNTRVSGKIEYLEIDEL